MRNQRLWYVLKWNHRLWFHLSLSDRFAYKVSFLPRLRRQCQPIDHKWWRKRDADWVTRTMNEPASNKTHTFDNCRFIMFNFTNFWTTILFKKVCISSFSFLVESLVLRNGLYRCSAAEMNDIIASLCTQKTNQVNFVYFVF